LSERTGPDHFASLPAHCSSRPLPARLPAGAPPSDPPTGAGLSRSRPRLPRPVPSSLRRRRTGCRSPPAGARRLSGPRDLQANLPACMACEAIDRGSAGRCRSVYSWSIGHDVEWSCLSASRAAGGLPAAPKARSQWHVWPKGLDGPVPGWAGGQKRIRTEGNGRWRGGHVNRAQAAQTGEGARPRGGGAWWGLVEGPRQWAGTPSGGRPTPRATRRPQPKRAKQRRRRWPCRRHAACARAWAPARRAAR